MSPDSYYDCPSSLGDDIQELSIILSELMLKKLPYDESTNDVVCEVMEAVAETIMEDEDLLEAVKSYVRRDGKPRVHSNVYEDARGLYEQSVD